MNLKMKHFLNDERTRIGVCFLFFLFMMLFNLMHSPLWGDEWVEYYYSQEAIETGELYHRIIRTFQPPLYNFLMHFWLKISSSLIWFRLFNIVIGFISAIFIYKTNRKLYSKKAGALSIVILAVCFQWVYCIQECSEYALMLMCLSASIYFYISCSEEFNYSALLGFILYSVLAIYSQYGSVFVAIPLLVLFFIHTIFSAELNKKRKLIVFGAYSFSFIAFAIPLYLLFLSIQLEQNGIADNTVPITGDFVRDVPFVFGQIIGYFFGVDDGTVWPVVFSIISVMILALCFITIMNPKVNWTKISIIIALIFGYALHFVLVQFHIYAMVHPGQSAGFFARYSYFYIPICSVAFPIIICENAKEFTGLGKLKRYATAILCMCILMASFIKVTQNWHKSYDDVYIKIWEQNEGWNDYTYLYGSEYGFYYYVKQLDNYEESFLNNVSTAVDNDHLPAHFWAWRTGWGGAEWQATIDKARSLGYKVTVCDDSGTAGQLAYCTLG